MSIKLGLLASSQQQASPLLLDTYPGATAAYSLRKLRSAYTGFCIQVRRSSDNTTQNIGFVNNMLDTASLLTFCGSGSGFVSIWYDQSGNSNNASQTNFTNQPDVVTLGTLRVSSNGKPSMFFTSNEIDRLTLNGMISGNVARTQIVVYQIPSPQLASGIFGQGFTATPGTWSYIQTRGAVSGAAGDPYFAGYAQDLGAGLTTPSPLIKIGTFYYNGTTGFLWKNNTQITSGALALNTDINQITQIGCSGGGSGTSFELSNGLISECILYLSNQILNATGINTNINSYYTIY